MANLAAPRRRAQNSACMQERHENEQYFFDQATVEACADWLERFERPCVLCAPMVGIELERRGAGATVLDIDERFAEVRGFRIWDLHRPVPLEDRFDVIFCDPPFFNISLSRLFQAVRVLAHYDFTQRVAISYLRRRREAILASFAPFHVAPTEAPLTYRTVPPCPRNEVELLANFPIPMC